jgi:hypothetical protein
MAPQYAITSSSRGYVNPSGENNFTPASMLSAIYPKTLGNISMSSGSKLVQNALNSRALSSNDKQEVADTSYNVSQYGNGNPFLNYKDYAGRNTDWHPSSLSMGVTNLNANVPLDTQQQRAFTSGNGIKVGNKSLKSWTYNTQTMSNVNFSGQQCNTDSDCASLGRDYTCNSNYSPWNDSKGTQVGSYCSYTIYPELLWSQGDETGSTGYHRLNVLEGGVGKACSTNDDCGTGYECNNSTDFVGSNVQQTGYCAQAYMCPDNKKRYLGYPYNSGIPIPPPRDQNNNGAGYNTLSECSEEALAQQRCVQKNGKYFAVYPGYCPLPPNYRKGNNPQGALQSESAASASGGFIIPSGLSTTKQSALGSSAGLGALSMNAAQADSYSPLQEWLSWNGSNSNSVQRALGNFGK